MNVDMMPAGREMDALVAEKVMGWYRVGAMWCAGANSFATQADVVEGCPKAWSPSADIAAAWEVLLKTIRTVNRGGSICFTNHFPDIYGIDIRFDGLDAVNADDLPLAICRAALKAVGL